MEKILFTIALIVSAMTVQAQTTPEARKDVADIRRLYAEAKKEMEGYDRMESEGQPPNKTVFSSNYNEAGTGPTKEVITYYFRVAYDEEAGMPFHRPFFITRKFNVAAREFYQESQGNSCRCLWLLMRHLHFLWVMKLIPVRNHIQMNAKLANIDTSIELSPRGTEVE